MKGEGYVEPSPFSLTIALPMLKHRICRNGHTVDKMDYRGKCFKCSAEQSKRSRDKLTKLSPWYACLERARLRAKKKELPCDLDCDWARARYTGKCELTGIVFKRANRKGGRCFSPSIDRIYPHLGYVKSNCRFILHGLNALKGSGTDNDMIFIASRLVNHR